MAHLPPKLCVHPMCNEVASHRGYCDYHKPKYIKTFAKSKLDKFYNTSAWKNTRRAVLMQEPLCRYCKENMILTEATEVDHIIRKRYYTGSPHDKSNLQPLCRSCHSMKTNRENKHYIMGTWDTDDNPYWVQLKEIQNEDRNSI